MRRTATAIFAVLMCLFTLSTILFSQEVASLTGVVADKTGAVIPNVAVKLVDTRTNSNYESETNSVGAYLFVKLPPGPGYKLTFSRDGFQSLTVSDVYLGVQSTRTQNVELEVGAVTETVDIKGVGQGVTLDTTDATIGNNFDMRSLHELPIEVRDSPAALLGLQPGVITAEANDDPNFNREGAVTGARADQGNITVDGIDANDFFTGQAFATIANAPVEAIQEFRGETANPLASNGRGSGAQIQLTTKSGTNEWHGSAWEYHRNTDTEANSFFNNRVGIPRAKLIRNQFGANLGGPIKKDKLFLFFDFDGRRDAREDNVLRIVPLDNLRSGSLAYINSGADCTAQSRRDTQPGCITTLTPAETAALDPQGIGANPALLAFINSRYPRANDLSAGNGVNTGGLRFNSPVGLTENTYTARIDYNITSEQKAFARFNIQRSSQGDDINFAAPIQFPGDPVTNEIVNHSYAYVVGHTWTISNNSVNQFVYGETRSDLALPVLFNPNGTISYSINANNGSGFSTIDPPFASQSSQARIIPVPTLRDDFSHMHGTHNWQFGGTWKPIKTRSSQVNDFNFVTFGLGGLLSSLDPTLRPSDINQDPSLIPLTLWDTDFTYALGRFGQISSQFNYGKNGNPFPQGTGSRRHYRYHELEFYGQDTWRVRSDFTMTYGLRYQYYSVPYETDGLEAIPNADFNTVFAARVRNGQLGASGPLSAPLLTYDLAGKANHARGLYNSDHKDFAPRLSFAYNPSFREGWLGRVFGDRKTVVRAGGNLVYDHVAVNAINFVQNQLAYLFQNNASIVYGSASDPAASLAQDPRFTGINDLPVNLPAPPFTRPLTPFVDASGNPFGTAQASVNYAIDPHFRTPYSITYSVGIQRELGGGFILDANYFSRLGRRLFAEADAGQVVDFRDPPSGQFLAAAFAAVSAQVRSGATSVTAQPFFENQISAAIGAPCDTALDASCTQFLADNLGLLIARGDLSSTLQILAGASFLASGVGLSPQFATNAYVTNKSSSNYNGLLVTLHKRLSHNLQFDFNYTLAHSIDNLSSVVNTVFGGLVCDVSDLRKCRGNSDFDVRHSISITGIYDLPFGRGQLIGRDASGWLNQMIGGWQLSGITTWRTGFAFSSATSAFPISFLTNAPGVFNGDTSAIKSDIHSDGSAIQFFSDPQKAQGAFRGPLGLESGNRNNLRGPHFSNVNLALAKNFKVTDKYRLQFRTEAYNGFNHPNFSLPNADITSGQFGVITTTSGNPRILQFALRVDF